MPLDLVPPAEMSRRHAPAPLSVPESFYWLLERPAPLAGMSYPPEDLAWSELRAMGFRHLVRLEPCDRPPSHLELAFDEALEDLAHGGLPDDPEREERLVREAAGVVIELIGSGEGVLVHCRGGTGRTGTVIGCALVGLGLSPARVAAHLDELMHRRGSWRRWPESEWQRQVLDRFSSVGREST